ncbi:MAG: hypothetical protein MJ231_06710 [bacterium]|nr:hypothetical protein [bacterium]
MKKTVSDLINHCKLALSRNVQYVYGAKMEVLTSSQIKSLQLRYGKNCVWDEDLKNAGKLCCDCSGLISSCTGIVRNSSGYKQSAEKVVNVSEIYKNWSNYVGWAVWLDGHIGVVSDKEGYYYAMDGSARDMVHFPMSRQKWVYALKLCDIDYSANTVKVKDIPVSVNGVIGSAKGVNIDGYNYFKIRDVADMTGAFKVSYENGRVVILV